MCSVKVCELEAGRAVGEIDSTYQHERVGYAVLSTCCVMLTDPIDLDGLYFDFAICLQKSYLLS